MRSKGCLKPSPPLSGREQQAWLNTLTLPMLKDPRPSRCDQFTSDFHLKEEALCKPRFLSGFRGTRRLGQLLNILLISINVCRVQPLHSRCCQELDTHMKRDEQEQNTPHVFLMENISRFLALLVETWTLGETLSVSAFVETKNRTSPSMGFSPTLLRSLWTSVNVSPPGLGEIHGKRWEGSRENS